VRLFRYRCRYWGRDLSSVALIWREPSAPSDRQTVEGRYSKGEYVVAESMTVEALAALAERLRRELTELQELREAVAEAERSKRDRQQHRGLSRYPEIL
jgi:hypothetical protein